MPERSIDDIVEEYQSALRLTQEDVDRANAKLNADLLQNLLEDCEERFRQPSLGDPAMLEGGGSFALFEAIDACARDGVPLPKWAADAFSDAFGRVHWAEVASWDEAFGRPWPKRTDLPAKRRHIELRTEIFLRVNLLHNGSEGDFPPIDEGLFERVGTEFGIKKTLCNKLYYQEKRRLDGGGLVIRIIEEVDG